MAIVKFINSKCPMNNIFPYVTRASATEEKLIDGVNCSVESAREEFEYVKNKFGKTDGRMYYHIVQSFSPDDKITPETAHEIGMKFAEYFEGYQMLVATHYNKSHIHNHLIMNSVNLENGKKFHQSAEDLIKVKQYSNELCMQYGLSVTEVKSRYKNNPKWKRELVETALYAMENTYTKEAFIQEMYFHGYRVRWDDNRKNITFTTPDGIKCRDTKLFDERLLKDNLEVYFALGGADTNLSKIYNDYETPEHHPNATMTSTAGLFSLLTDLLTVAPPRQDYSPDMVNEMSPFEKARLEKILGKRISPKAVAHYSTQEEYEQAMVLSW